MKPCNARTCTILGASVAFAASATAPVADGLISAGTNLYGNPGLVDMPTADSAPDANLSFTSAHFGNTSRNTLTFQITPRLSGSFRYSALRGYYPPGFPDGTTLYDRSFDLRFRIVDEAREGLRPAIAIGLRDFMGTGVYAGEYVVATKSIGERLRLTAGLGWGRLGSRGGFASPLGARPPLDFGEGGKPNFDQWFRGPVAAFGGLNWQASDKLTLKAEYSSDKYEVESARGVFDARSPWNFGFDYQIRKGVTLSGYYLYGNEIGASLSFAINPRISSAPSGNEPAPLPVKPRASASALGWDTQWVQDTSTKAGIQQAAAEALARDGIFLSAMALHPRTAEVRIENTRYMAEPEAIGRTVRVLTRALPESVETITITSLRSGVPASRVTLARRDIEALEHAPATAILSRARIEDAAGPADPALRPTPGIPPRLTWSVSPYLRASIFDPDSPLRADLGLRARARYRLAPGLELAGSVRKKLVGNLDSTTRVSDSTLPHVRSDFALYDKQGDPALENLTLAWYARPGRNLYSRVTVGYLEEMYGGISGELLWKPVDSRLALGAEINYVKQRDFDQGFGFQDYDIAMGKLSAYYAFGNGFHGQIDVGRYLAGDWGTTISLNREFANGWKIGAYATFTNVSAADFGEGSFDKGITLTIPFSALTGQPSRASSDITLRSLTRDGGAQLEVGGRLYERVRDTHRPDLEARWGRFWR